MDLSDDEKNVLNSNGGLNVDSIWYIDSEYRAVVEKGYSGVVTREYKLSHEDVVSAREFIESRGISNTVSSNALIEFINIFMK